jgi:hypothetical protein
MLFDTTRGRRSLGQQNMTTRSVGPGAGFGWLSQGISAAFNHPKSLFGGAALLLVVLLLPSLITMPMQFHFMREGTPPSTTTTLLIMAISMLFGLLIIPLYAGYLQMVDSAEREEEVSASDIFKPYRQGKAWQLIGLGVAHLVIYIAGLAVIILATGGGIASWYMQVLAAQANHEVPPGVPGGFWIGFALLVVFGLLMMGFYAISLGQVALNRRSVFGAIGDGVTGALKNVLPLFVFALVSILAWIVFAIVMLIVALVLGFIAKLISPWLMFIVLVPLYIAMILLMITTIFGVMYHLWRDVCGDDAVAATPPPLAA